MEIADRRHNFKSWIPFFINKIAEDSEIRDLPLEPFQKLLKSSEDQVKKVFLIV